MKAPLPIAQLQAMYKAINGVEAGDVHRLQASYMFDVPYIAVNKEQREEAKKFNFKELYSDEPVINSMRLKIRNTKSYRPVTNWAFRPTA